MSWTPSVIVSCFLLAVFCIWLEYRREDRSRLIWRIAASVIAAIALACIALPVAYQGDNQIYGDNQALLLTEGYHTDSISHAGYKMILTTDKGIKKAYPKAILLTGIQDINAIRPAIKLLHIVGYGLNAAELQQLNAIAVVYHVPTEAVQGVQSVNWPQQLKAGDLLQVQGKYNNTTSGTVKLLLNGLNTPLDSVSIPAKSIIDFELSTTPKITGRAAFSLLALNGKDTLEKESIPLAVEAVKPIKVLMLSASPDFESNFLKNWLSQHGYAIATRTVITKNKISQDFVNMEKLPLERLTPALFHKFDVVIGDLSALKGLSAPESGALKQEAQSGLGIIVRADSSGKDASWLQNDFQVNTITSKSLAVTLLLQGQKSKTAPLNVDPLYIRVGDNNQNLVADAQNHILAASTISGEGKLIFTTLNATYTWMLAGNSRDYTALWSLLISKAGRRTLPAASWTAQSTIATAGDPVSLQLPSGTVPATLTIDHSVVSPVQNPLIAYEWNAVYWPQNPGWQLAGTNPASWWYSYPKNSWKSIKNRQKMEETKNYSDNRIKLLTVTKQIQQLAPIEVPKMYFYLILLAAFTFLWVEKKLSI
jgi:hypothetical protein